ncbi:MAG: hypothetical protein AAB474_01255 [Patescibacteria group bacterium]
MSVNLLPQDYQKKIKAERLRRLIAAFGFLIFIAIAANIALLLPLRLAAVLQQRELRRELEIIQKKPLFIKVVDIEQTIKNLNSQANLFQAQESGRFELAPVMESVLSSRPAGVNIESFIFEVKDQAKNQPARISISGRARSRPALMDFIKTNESNRFFSRVGSPSSNLLKEQDIDYSLVLELNNEI